MIEHVIAMDPGGRSGWASADMTYDRFEYTGGGVLRQDLMADWFAEKQRVGRMGGGGSKGCVRPSMEVMPPGDPDINLWVPCFTVMVYESWYPREENDSMEWIKGDRLLTPQHIGALRWIAHASGAKIVTQHPTDKPQAVATMPDVLRLLDRDSNEQHDQDARMHLWLYYWRNWLTGKIHPPRTVRV